MIILSILFCESAVMFVKHVFSVYSMPCFRTVVICFVGVVLSDPFISMMSFYWHFSLIPLAFCHSIFCDANQLWRDFGRRNLLIQPKQNMTEKNLHLIPLFQQRWCVLSDQYHCNIWIFLLSLVALIFVREKFQKADLKIEPLKNW